MSKFQKNTSFTTATFCRARTDTACEQDGARNGNAGELRCRCGKVCKKSEAASDNNIQPLDPGRFGDNIITHESHALQLDQVTLLLAHTGI